GRGRLLPLDTGSVRSVDRRDVIRSTIDSGITGSLRCRHSAGIQGTPPFNCTAAGDGAVVGVRCGVVLMVVTSTGLRSTGGSLHCFAQVWLTRHLRILVAFFFRPPAPCGLTYEPRNPWPSLPSAAASC